MPRSLSTVNTLRIPVCGGVENVLFPLSRRVKTHVYPEVERAGGALLDTWLGPALGTQFQALTESIYEYENEQMPVNQHTGT